MMQPHDFLWMAVLGIIVGFIYAFGIGSNDVANAFASSVSAKSLTLGQAICVASLFEFLGAVAIGSGVTGTIRSGIIDSSYYVDDPELLMFGMLSSLIVGGTWLLTATYLEFPVSTTHTIVGAIIGFSLAAFGFESIQWKGVGKLVASWVGSPVFTGVVAFIFYYPVRKFVMEHENSFDRAVVVFPIVVFIALAVDLYFVLFKMNTVNQKVENYGHIVVLPVALGGAALIALLTYLFIAPALKRRVEYLHANLVAEREAAAKKKDEKVEKGDSEEVAVSDVDKTPEVAAVDVDGADTKKEGAIVTSDPVAQAKKGLWDTFADNTFRQDLYSMSMHESKGAKSIWDNAIVYEEKTEFLFTYLQVFTACLTSFAHGGNDVANAIAPLSAILSIYRTGEFTPKSPVHRWVLALGGFGIACGFTFFGYRIIKAVGYKLTCITPSRGFCIELATALAVASASFIGLPVSSTQCLVGATAGAGIAAGGFKNVQWTYFARTCIGWAVIFLAAVICNAGFFAYSIYSPNVL